MFPDEEDEPAADLLDVVQGEVYANLCSLFPHLDPAFLKVGSRNLLLLQKCYNTCSSVVVIPDPRPTRHRIPDSAPQQRIEVFVIQKIVTKFSEIGFGMFIPDPGVGKPLDRGAFLYVWFQFLLVSNKFCYISLLHWPLFRGYL